MLGSQANRIGSARGLYRSLPRFEAPCTASGRDCSPRRTSVSQGHGPIAGRSSSSVRRASSNCAGSNSHSRSRPTLTSRTRPAAASTPKCLVTACRDDLGPRCQLRDGHGAAHAQRGDQREPNLIAQGRENRREILQRLGSDPAALRLGDMLFDVLHLFDPSPSCSCGTRLRGAPAEFYPIPIRPP